MKKRKLKGTHKFNLDLQCTGMLRSIDWQLVTDVSGQPKGPAVKGEAVQLILEDEADRLSRNFGN